MGLIVILAIVVAPAHGARADAAAESRFHDELARRHYAQGRYEDAIQEFYLVQRITPNARNLFNIGTCFEKLNEEVEAFLSFSEYLASLAPDDPDDGRRAEAERSLARIGPNVARVRVASDPPGAHIYVDRVDIGSYGRTPRLIAVRPGTHSILLEAEGHRPAEITIDAAAGVEVPAQASLEPILGTMRVRATPEAVVRVRNVRGELVGEGDAPFETRLPPGAYTIEAAAPGYRTTRDVVRVEEETPAVRDLVLEPLPRPTGRLTVTSNIGGALVRLDDVPSGFAPIVLPDVVVGAHRLRVEAEGMQPFDGTVDIEADASSWATVTLEREGAARHSPAMWVLGAGGLGALAAGAITGGLALANHREFEDAVEAGGGGANVNELRDRGAALNTATDTLLITGALALGAAIVLFILEEQQEARVSRGAVTRSSEDEW